MFGFLQQISTVNFLMRTLELVNILFLILLLICSTNIRLPPYICYTRFFIVFASSPFRTSQLELRWDCHIKLFYC